LGCALRRSELASLECAHIQQRDDRWVFVDLVGKGKRIRTVPIPPFVKAAIDGLEGRGRFIGGPLVSAGAPPRISGKDPVALSERIIRHIVTKYAASRTRE
jgi:integrase